MGLDLNRRRFLVAAGAGAAAISFSDLHWFLRSKQVKIQRK